MDITHVRTVLEIIKRGSFSEAASALNISQPAVSLHVQRLERELGARLLDRGGSRVHLTQHGEAFLKHARRIDAAEADMREDIARLAHDLTGTLRLAASTIPGEFLLPSLLADFTALHHNVVTDLSVSDTEAVISALENGTRDVGFTGAPVSRSNLTQKPVYKDALALVVPASHPLAGRSSVSVADLADERLIARESGSGTMASIRRILTESGLDPQRWSPGVVLGSTQAVLSGVEAGLGISFVSALAARRGVHAGTIAIVPVDGLTLERDLYMVYAQDHISTRLLEEFTRFAGEWLAHADEHISGKDGQS